MLHCFCIFTTMTILKLFILLMAILQVACVRRPATTSHKPHHVENSAESETVIENKNVNVVVNVDPKEVATELWKIIEKEHPSLQYSAGSRSFVSELAEVIKPYLESSRRSEPLAFEVASNLDFVTRRAINSQPTGLDAADEESLTRTIVAKMMTKLRDLRVSGSNDYNDLFKQSSRRMLNNNNEKKAEYENEDSFDLLIKIRKGKVIDTSLV